MKVLMRNGSAEALAIEGDGGLTITRLACGLTVTHNLSGYRIAGPVNDIRAARFLLEIALSLPVDWGEDPVTLKQSIREKGMNKLTGLLTKAGEYLDTEEAGGPR